jgi:IS30 family transposase
MGSGLSNKQTEEKEKIKEWCNQKVPISEIASRLNKTIPTVYYHMRSMGIYKSKEQKLGHVKQLEPKTSYDMPEPEEVVFKDLPSNIYFKHDRSYTF